ncbi:MAG TPA: hypothetical protein VMW62_08820 [Chloroflexota bacterium]|nr:hypothetical protein [Chloroflexota bacterium]
MMLVLFVGLRSVASRVTAAAAGAALAAPEVSSPAKPQASLAAAATPTASAAPAAIEATATPGGVVEVDPKTLTQSPGTYRSRLIKVRGTVFFTSKLEGGKNWIQIVDKNNVYVDGQTSDLLPAGVAKGVVVDLTGIGAGLYTVTAQNGKDYDQAFIDPIQKIDVIR